MKTKSIIILLVIFAIAVKPIRACDQCGCSVSGSYNGLMAFNTDNFIGLRFASYSFNGRSELSDPVSSHFMTIDLTGAFKVNKKWQILGYLPYKKINYSAASASIIKIGLADAGIINTITVFSNTDDLMRKHTHFLFVKAGVEIPTGKFNDGFRVDQLPASIATGSGSFDLMTGLQYKYQKNDLSLFGDYSFKYSLPNSSHYRFGSEHTMSFIVSEKVMKNEIKIVPYMGLTEELIQPDTYYNYEQAGTQGSDLFMNVGIETGFKSFSAGLNYDLPLVSNFDGDTFEAANRFALRIHYSF